MSPNLATALSAVEALTTDERQALIDHLLDEVDDEPEPAAFELSPAWKEEIARRSAEIDAGGVPWKTWDEIKAKWAARETTGG